jgi:hypothetical protein
MNRTTEFNVEERFWSKVEGSGDCLVWAGAKSDQGYGTFNYMGENMPVQRAAYLLTYGAIPQGLQIDHLCRNRLCANPQHLEAVTQKENLLRGETIPAINLAKTHCVNGHKFISSNTIYRHRGNSICRTCIKCALSRSRVQYARIKLRKETSYA